MTITVSAAVSDHEYRDIGEPHYWTDNFFPA